MKSNNEMKFHVIMKSNLHVIMKLNLFCRKPRAYKVRLPILSIFVNSAETPLNNVFYYDSIDFLLCRAVGVFSKVDCIGFTRHLSAFFV